MTVSNNYFNKPTQIIKLSACPKPFEIQKTVEESIIMSLLNLADDITKKGDTYFLNFGITTLQYKTMLYLAGDPNIEYVEANTSSNPIVASQLASALNVSRPNVTNLLNLLIEKNLVAQIKDKKDWRRKPLVLTPEGWELIEKMQPNRQRINRQLLGHLSEDEKICMLESLRICHELLYE
jgi:DNA-binding MarR family transcriptional regulator